jgi:tetratricopeptide (TPR) repeat protein
MSYIHEALQKAQKHKDTTYPKYKNIFLVRKRKPGIFAVRPIWVICLFVILLAFALYSWLDSSGKETISAPKDLKPETSPTSEIVVDAKHFYERARHFHKIGRLKDARRLYQKAIMLDKGHVYAVNNLGVIGIQEGKYLEARKNFEHAVRLRPEYVDPHYNLACLHAVRGEAKRALEHLKRAVLLDKSVRGWAREDRDLQNLRGVPGFEEIIRSGVMEKVDKLERQE